MPSPKIITEIIFSATEKRQKRQYEPKEVFYSVKRIFEKEVDEDKELYRLEKIINKHIGEQMEEPVEKKPWKPYPKPFPDGEVTIEDMNFL